MTSISTLIGWLLNNEDMTKTPPARPRHPSVDPARQPAAIDFRYRTFLRTHGCCACGGGRYVNVVETDHGPVPLCSSCYIGDPDSLYQLGPSRFQAKAGIRFSAVTRNLKALFDEARP